MPTRHRARRGSGVYDNIAVGSIPFLEDHNTTAEVHGRRGADPIKASALGAARWAEVLRRQY
jgi:hypothetical protein